MKFMLSIIAIGILMTAGFGQSLNINNSTFLGVEAISIQSIGHFEENWKSGSGVYAGYENVYGNNWALVLQTGYIEFKENPDAGYLSDPSFTIIPLRIGGKFYILKSIISPYLSATAGANIISQKYETTEKTMDVASTSFHFQVGAGIALNIYKSVRINLAARYNSHLLEPGEPYNITALEYSLGVNFRIGKN